MATRIYDFEEGNSLLKCVHIHLNVCTSFSAHHLFCMQTGLGGIHKMTYMWKQ